MPAGDIYLLRDQQLFLNVSCENRYFVSQTSGTGVAINLTFAWNEGPHVNVLSVQSTGVTDVQMIADNLTDPTDFDTRITVLAGVRPGEPMPPYAAWGFTLFTTNKIIRAGGKRYAGVSETDQANGLRAAGIVSETNALANALNSSFVNSVTGDTYKVILYTPGNSKTPTPTTPLAAAVASVAYTRLTTQSSRKFA